MDGRGPLLSGLDNADCTHWTKLTLPTLCQTHQKLINPAVKIPRPPPPSPTHQSGATACPACPLAWTPRTPPSLTYPLSIALLHQSMMEIPPLYPTAIALASVLAAQGYRKGSLSLSGAIAAFLVGYGHLANPLQAFGYTLIFFYWVGSQATKVSFTTVN